MCALKIGIVEDNLIIAGDISEMLQENGYEVTEPATRYSEAIGMIESENPDLLLLDIQIMGKLDGIEVAKTVNQNFDIPFIFLTANTDFDTIERAKEVGPSAYLAKPITQAQLYAAIEIAIANYTHRQMESVQRQDPAEKQEQAAARPGFIFVKDGYHFRKVHYTELIYAESDLNYVTLHLLDGSKPMIRSTIGDFAERLSKRDFIRVHRSCIVAVDKIEKVTGNEVLAGGYTVPMSKTYREEVLRVLGIRL